ncbi:MAG: protein-glutamate O-methyltransferase CheR [Granulosicoccus sp.]
MARPVRSDPDTPFERSSEVSMNDEVYAGFQRLALEQTGIELAESKRAMIVNRFARRLCALGLDSFEEYLSRVADQEDPESREFINTITTNLTYFFREPHHFEIVKNRILPELVERSEASAPIRLWSAACSSGQEPYTLAITVRETEATRNRHVKILCTDIDSAMVAKTVSGRYKGEQMRGLSTDHRDTWFKKSRSGVYEVDETLRSMLICKQLNLFQYWPIKPGVDLIMCRNVLIYFSLVYQKKLLKKFADIQRPGSYLVLGHSETLSGFDNVYKRIDNTVYERI